MLFAQDGHQPAEKIIKAFDNNYVQGVVLCPRGLKPEKVDLLIDIYRESHSNKTVILDPNFYVFSLPATANIGKLNLYPYYPGFIDRKDFTSRNIVEYVQKTIDYQTEKNFDILLSPSVIIPSFNSPWSQIALQLFSESISYKKSNSINKELYLTLVIGEAAFREDEQFSSYLDDLTTLECDGFYIIIERSTDSFPQWSDPTTLAKFMYLINNLHKQGFKTIIGHTDIVGLVLKAVGADSIANGWWKNLKQFSRNRYFPSGFGHPKSTYTSKTLLNSIFINPYLQQITEVNLGDKILALDGVDNILSKDPVAVRWNQEDSVLQHWKTLNELFSEIDTLPDTVTKIASVKNRIDAAIELYRELRMNDIEFDNSNGPAHLRVWKDALNMYESAI